MMTNDNYSSPKKYKVEAATSCLYDKENNLTDTAAYIQGNTTLAFEDTDMSKTENANENTTARRSRTRRSRDQIADESSRNSEEIQVEGATAQAEKPKSSKKEKPSGKKRKDRKNLREKRRSTGVVIMPGLGVSKVCLCYKTELISEILTYCNILYASYIQVVHI